MPSVLVVEDEPSIRHLIAAVITTMGLRAITVESAEDALSLLETFRPDLIVTDNKLPGIQGEQLIGMLRNQASTRDLLVILTSAYAEPDRHQADWFLPKPFDLDDMVDCINKCLGAAAAKQSRAAKK